MTGPAKLHLDLPLVLPGIVNARDRCVARVVESFGRTKVPADGVVIVGTTSVDQAPVTGESVPVDSDRPTMRRVLAAFDRVGPKPRLEPMSG